MNKSSNVKVMVGKHQTEVSLFAKRGSIAYGVGRTAQNNIVLVELVETLGAFEVIDKKFITYREIQQEERVRENNTKCTIRCFIANAYLEEQYPDLNVRLYDKINQLIAEIPQAEIFEF